MLIPRTRRSPGVRLARSPGGRAVARCAALVALALAAPVFAAPAAVPESERFDLAGADREFLSGVWLQERRRVPQSFAFDPTSGDLYVLQVEGANEAGSAVEHHDRGNLTLSRLRITTPGQAASSTTEASRHPGTSARAELVGHMRLRGFGHGVSIGVEPTPAGLYIWTEVDSEDGWARGRRLGRFLFTDAVTLDTSSDAIRKFELVSGARVCTPSLDLAHGRLAMKYHGTDGRGHIALFDTADVLAGGTTPLADIRLPQDLGTLQGWCTYGSFVYILTGNPYSAHNPPPGNAELWCLDWNTGAIVQRVAVTALADLVFREPEGLAVEVSPDGPRLCLGFGASVSTTDSRRRLHVAIKTALIPAPETP